jgi:hypothetical protein
LRVAQMAQESCRIVAQVGFYPSNGVDEAYLKRFIPMLEQRLALAGVRFAAILNELDNRPGSVEPFKAR